MGKRRVLKLFCILFLLIFLTGCKSNTELARETVDENVKKDCDEFEAKVSKDFGGGEGEAHGYIQIGYCDGKLTSVAATSKSSSPLSRDFKYSKNDFEYPNNYFLQNLLESSLLLRVNSYDDNDDGNEYQGLTIELVVNEANIKTLLSEIEYNFIPELSDGIEEDNISIYIYSTKEEQLKSDDVVISYLIEKDDTRFGDKEYDKYDLVEYLGVIRGNGYSYNGQYHDDVGNQISESIKAFKTRNNL